VRTSNLTLNINELILRSWVLVEKPAVVQLLKNVAILYGIGTFITVYTTALH
jgi:hypothetical protein